MVEAPFRILSFTVMPVQESRGGIRVQSHIELWDNMRYRRFRVLSDYPMDQVDPDAVIDGITTDLSSINKRGRRRLATGLARQRFVCRPGTDKQILTRIPHRHTSYEELVAKHRRYRRAEGSFSGRFTVEKPYIPGWRLRAPEISDWDTSE